MLSSAVAAEPFVEVIQDGAEIGHPLSELKLVLLIGGGVEGSSCVPATSSSSRVRPGTWAEHRI